MRTIEEVQSDPTLNSFQAGGEITAILNYQRENPSPSPLPEPLSPATVASLRKIQTTLRSAADSLKTHDEKVAIFQPMVSPLRSAVAGSMASAIDFFDRDSIEKYSFVSAKLGIVEHFLANSNLARAEMCSATERELRLLTATLQQAAKFDNIHPPEFTAGHTLESRVQLAIAFISSLI
jgi:hypothetical protein